MFLKTRQARTTGRIMDDLISTLAESEEICRHFDGTEIVLGTSATSMNLALLARWLLARCHEVGPEPCVEDLSRFLVSDQLEGEEKLVLTGIMIGGSALSMTDGIFLESLPFFADSGELALIYDSWGASLMDSPELYRPKAALVCNTPLKKWIGLDLPQSERFMPRYDELAAVCSSLTALDDSCPMPMGYWWQAAEWVPCAGLNGFRVSLASSEGRVLRDIRILSEAERQAARSIVLRFRESGGSYKTQLHIVLNRMNKSRRRQSLVDRAIELGIAADSLFLYEPGSSYRSEVTFRLKLRAAWFLADSPDERKVIMKKMDAFYECRSAVMHTGRLEDRPATRQALDEGEKPIAIAVRKILDQGSFPNWSSLVLGNVSANEPGLNTGGKSH